MEILKRIASLIVNPFMNMVSLWYLCILEIHFQVQLFHEIDFCFHFLITCLYGVFFAILMKKIDIFLEKGLHFTTYLIDILVVRTAM